MIDLLVYVDIVSIYGNTALANLPVSCVDKVARREITIGKSGESLSYIIRFVWRTDAVTARECQTVTRDCGAVAKGVSWSLIILSAQTIEGLSASPILYLWQLRLPRPMNSSFRILTSLLPCLCISTSHLGFKSVPTSAWPACIQWHYFTPSGSSRSANYLFLHWPTCRKYLWLVQNQWSVLLLLVLRACCFASSGTTATRDLKYGYTQLF